MSDKPNLVGLKFGRLTVVKEDGRSNDLKIMWCCLCDCGRTSRVNTWRLVSGKTKSCACIRVDGLLKTFTKHGHSRAGKHTTEYTTWINIKQRCYNPNNDRFSDWGGRGIIVCKRWLGKNGFKNFMADMGPKPSKNHSIDRKNNDGNYTPSNCRWGTRREQAANTSKNRWITHAGTTMILADWARELNANGSEIARSLKNGKSFNSIYNYYKYEKKKSFD